MPDNKIKSFATAHWDAPKAARPLAPRRYVFVGDKY